MAVIGDGLSIAQIDGEVRAKAIQLAIEYDPQPPFDSAHRSTASATTKAAATELLSKDNVKPTIRKATTLLAWEQASAAVRSRRQAAARSVVGLRYITENGGHSSTKDYGQECPAGRARASPTANRFSGCGATSTCLSNNLAWASSVSKNSHTSTIRPSRTVKKWA